MTEHAPAKPWSGIDFTKTIAGTLAAISAAVIGSYLGVAGTLIGAAVASIVGSIGTELYQRWLHRGQEKIKETFVTAPAAIGTPAVAAAEDEVPSAETTPAQPVKMRWGRIAAVAGAVFVLAMGSLLTFELISGRTVADAVGNKTSSHSTTICSAFCGRSDRNKTPAPTESASTEPSEDPKSTTPSETPSADPGATPAAPPAETTEPADPQQGDGTDSGTTPTEEPTEPTQDPADGQTQQDGSQQNGSQQDGSQLNQQSGAGQGTTGQGSGTE
jgi:hypothetical protein